MNYTEMHPAVNEGYMAAASEAFEREHRLSYEMLRPFRLMPTTISIDGNKWCVLYGQNLQDGVAGFGDSPDEASRDFDRAWYAKLAAAKGDETDDQVS